MQSQFLFCLLRKLQEGMLIGDTLQSYNVKDPALAVLNDRFNKLEHLSILSSIIV